MPGTDASDGLSGSFDKVADDVPHILWSVDGDGRHDYVNRQLRRIARRQGRGYLCYVLTIPRSHARN